MRIEFYTHSMQCATELIEEEGIGYLDVVVHLRPLNVGTRSLVHSEACEKRREAMRTVAPSDKRNLLGI